MSSGTRDDTSPARQKAANSSSRSTTLQTNESAFFGGKKINSELFAQLSLAASTQNHDRIGGCHHPRPLIFSVNPDGAPSAFPFVDSRSQEPDAARLEK
jgi:hypothetical protein